MMKNLLICTCVFSIAFLCVNCTRENLTNDNLFHVPIPEWNKFVVVTGEEGTPIYKDADDQSPTLLGIYGDDYVIAQTCWSDAEIPNGYNADPSQVYPDEVLVVLGEEGGFYKICLNYYQTKESPEYGYIKKDQAKEIKAEQLTHAIAEEQGFRVMKERKYKDLVIGVTYNEMDDFEELYFGLLLKNGCIAFPQSYVLYPTPGNADIISFDGETLFYPNSIATQDKGMEIDLFDPQKLDSTQIDKIFTHVVDGYLGDVEYMYYFPELDNQLHSFYVPSEKDNAPEEVIAEEDMVFSFDAPQFLKFVKVIDSNVNVRKHPSVQSGNVYNATQNEVMAVVGESDEWYQVCTSYWDAPYAEDGGNATEEVTVVGYIMKENCVDFALSNFKDEANSMGLMQRKNGRYKDICIYTTYSGHDENWCGLSFAIGKKIGDIACLPYRIIVDEYAETSKRIEFVKDGNGYQMVLNQDLIDGMDILFDKFSDDDIEFIINNVSKMAKNSGRVIFHLSGEDVDSEINYGGKLNQMNLIQY